MTLFQETILFFIIYLSLYAIFIYLFSFLFAGNKTVLKIKVFLINYSFAIFMLVYAINKLINGFTYQLVFVIAIILLVLLFNFTVHRRHYLSDFIASADEIKIEYITPSLKTLTVIYTASDINDFELVNRSWLINYPASLNIKNKNKWHSYEIVDTKLRKKINEQAVMLK